eukprot:NODE_1004_length_2328_cov_0.331090.p1 type:complete len:301 gc:universal NODE_1004_length_2328_cov_0.331090:1100-198(-)
MKINLVFIALFVAIVYSNPRSEDYFQRLGLPRSATDKDIKRAYRKLAAEYHPDRNKDEDASELFSNIGEAYEVLKNEEKRNKYIKYGKEGLNMHDMGHDPFEAFRHFFHGNMQQQEVTGPDVTMDLWVSLKHVLKGKRIRIAVASATFKSPTLQHEVFEFDIPSGVKDGTQFVKERILPDFNARNRYSYAVDDDNEDILPGNIKFKVRICDDARFIRESDNLRYVQHIGLKHALLGFDLKVEHIDGTDLHLKRDRITHNGFTQVFKGKGVGGDLFVQYEIILPLKLNDQQTRLIKEAFDE